MKLASSILGNGRKRPMVHIPATYREQKEYGPEGRSLGYLYVQTICQGSITRGKVFSGDIDDITCPKCLGLEILARRAKETV